MAVVATLSGSAGPLHDLRNLEGACISSLTIQHNSLSDRDIDLIATITTLRRLDFQHSTISGESSSHSATETEPDLLSLWTTEKDLSTAYMHLNTDVCFIADLGAISRLCGLKELNLDHVPYISKIDDLSRLSILTDLTTLSVGHSDVDRTALYDFKDFFPVLKEINMAYSSLLTHSGARFRFNFFPHLVSLTLDGYADMRDLTPLEHLTHFKSFAFRDCGLKNEWLTSLSFVTDLESLALSRNTNLNDEGMQHLLVLRSLRTLECNQLQNVTSLGMGSMISLLTQLTRLEVINTGVDVHQLGQTDESLCIVV